MKPRSPIDFSIISLGCPKNLVDSENMVGRLRTAGFRFLPRAASCDFVLLNTCGFLESAREEAREYLEELLELKRRGAIRRVFVTGCLVNFEKDAPLELFPEVDGWVGVFEEKRIVEIVRQFFPQAEQREQAGPTQSRIDRSSRYYFSEQDRWKGDDANRFLLTPPHVAYLKIADGCNRHCAYCAIPEIRGRFVSKPREAVLEEAKKLADQGVKELIVIAQETTFWGSDLYGKPDLARLLSELREIEGPERIRLMYTYPLHFEEELVSVLSEGGKIVPYIDLPLQHANDTILKRMRRAVNRSQTEALLSQLRERIPNLVLRTSLIAGFPGETEAMFRELVDFTRQWAFERGGAFRFSPEPGTAAAALDEQLPFEVIDERFQELCEVQEKIMSNWDEKRVGREFEVLLDRSFLSPEGKPIKDVFLGRTYAEAPDIDPLVIVTGKKLKSGDCIACEIVQLHESNLIAVPSN